MERANENRDSQVSLRTMFWITIACAMLLVYSQSLGRASVLIACIYSGVALGIGTLVGLLFRRLFDALFWSGLMTLMAYLAIAGGRLPNDAIVYGWALLAATAGAFSGIDFPKRLWHAIVGMGTLGAGLMILFLWAYRVPIRELVLFDVYCAAAIGAAIPAAIFAIKLHEPRNKGSRLIMAAWLTLCVVVGNMLVPVLGGVQR